MTVEARFWPGIVLGLDMRHLRGLRSHFIHGPLSNEDGTTLQVVRARPESDPDCLKCAIFARQREGVQPPGSQTAVPSSHAASLAVFPCREVVKSCRVGHGFDVRHLSRRLRVWG